METRVSRSSRVLLEGATEQVHQQRRKVSSPRVELINSISIIIEEAMRSKSFILVFPPRSLLTSASFHGILRLSELYRPHPSELLHLWRHRCRS